MSRLTEAWRGLTGQRTGTLSDYRDQGYRSRRNTSPTVNQDTAMRNSVWWAGLHLRANVVSSFPLDVVKPGPDGLMYAIPNPGPLVSEPFPGVDITEFQYSSEMDLGRYGNTVGIIRARNALGKPAQVELVPMGATTAKMNGRTLVNWKIDGQDYDPSEIWHQRRHTLPGLPLGMNVLAAAAYAMGTYASAQAFALDWFAGGAAPRGVLKNNKKDNIPPEIRQLAKDQFRDSTAGGEIFVTGNEWDWTPTSQDAMSSGFLASMAASERDICRYAGVPASMVDVETSTGNITYANVTQANLQWLITEIGPAARMTERYWSRVALPKPWQLKLNTDALLRMDPAAKADMMIKLSTAKLRAPDELRALDNLPPFTDDQVSQMSLFASMGKPAPAAPTTQLEGALPWQTPA